MPSSSSLPASSSTHFPNDDDEQLKLRDPTKHSESSDCMPASQNLTDSEYAIQIAEYAHSIFETTRMDEPRKPFENVNRQFYKLFDAELYKNYHLLADKLYYEWLPQEQQLSFKLCTTLHDSLSQSLIRLLHKKLLDVVEANGVLRSLGLTFKERKNMQTHTQGQLFPDGGIECVITDKTRTLNPTFVVEVADTKTRQELFDRAEMLWAYTGRQIKTILAFKVRHWSPDKVEKKEEERQKREPNGERGPCRKACYYLMKETQSRERLSTPGKVDFYSDQQVVGSGGRVEGLKFSDFCPFGGLPEGCPDPDIIIEHDELRAIFAESEREEQFRIFSPKPTPVVATPNRFLLELQQRQSSAMATSAADSAAVRTKVAGNEMQGDAGPYCM